MRKRIFFSLTSAFLLAGAPFALAQDATPPAAAQSSPTPAGAPQAASVPNPSGPLPEKPLESTEQHPAFTEPMSLIPETVTPVDKPGIPASAPDVQLPFESGSGPKISKTAASEEAIKEHVRFQQLRIIALKDPIVQDDWRDAWNAKTDPEKRAALRLYYNRLFDLIAKKDSSIQTLVDTRRTETLHRLEQNRIQSNDSHYEAAATGEGPYNGRLPDM